MTQLKATVSPRNGGPKYTVDLTEFEIGGREETILKSTSWSGDYTGRPQLAREFANVLESDGPTQHSCDRTRSSLRAFFRYLDWKERRSDGPRTDSCSQITDAMGIEFRQWLASDHVAYRQVKTVLNAKRRLIGVRPLFWPNRRPDREDFREPPSQEGMRQLYHALKHEARSIKAMFAEGESLAVLGRDPRLHGDWHLGENRIFLMKTILEDGIPDRAAVVRAGARQLMTGAGPDYLAPTLDQRFGSGLSGALRWFVPGRSETAVFFWLFLLGTGWNPATACGVDVLDPDGWHQPHPQSDLFAVIHAWKRRADRHQFAISMTRPEWHPYRILEYIIERTAPLRRHVLVLLKDARRRATTNPGLDLDREIADLDRLSRTPWLFASRNIGTVSGFVGKNDNGLLAVVRAVVARAGLDNEHWNLGGVIAKDARLAWIGHAYVHSGYHQLLTKLAGNHGSLRTTRHYIRSMRYRAYSEEQVRKMQDALFSEVGFGRVIDPTRLRLLVENGLITAEQERRLADYRQRTTVGMGCLDPRSPPKNVDPDHPEGALCRVQRCTGCPHGIVFPESMSPLARRLAELTHLRRNMPMAAWDGSSLAEEQESVGQTLAHFDTERVQAEIAAWMTKLNSGEITVHGTYPSY